MKIPVNEELLELFPDAAKLSELPRKAKKKLKKSLARQIGVYLSLAMTYNESL